MSDKEIEKLETNLREVFYCVKYTRDKDRLYEVIKENEERFGSLTLNAKNVIENISSLKIKSNRKGGYNMCEAIEGIKKDAKIEGIKEGIKEGIEKGRKEGEEKGRKEGMKKGRKNGITAAITALDMLKNKYSDDEIVKQTGVTAEELDELKRQLV